MMSTPCRVSFAAKLKFCHPAEYFSKRPKAYDTFYPTLQALLSDRENHQRQFPGNPAYPWGYESIAHTTQPTTGNILTCSAGALTDGTNGITFHLVPEASNLAALSTPFSSVLSQRLKQGRAFLSSGRLSALIIGGDCSLPFFKQASAFLFEQLLAYFRFTLRIQPSYFWGQNLAQDPRGVEAYYVTTEDTWYLLKYKPRSTEGVTTWAELCQAFQKIYLAPGDTLILNCPQRLKRGA